MIFSAFIEIGIQTKRNKNEKTTGIFSNKEFSILRTDIFLHVESLDLKLKFYSTVSGKGVLQVEFEQKKLSISIICSEKIVFKLTCRTLVLVHSFFVNSINDKKTVSCTMMQQRKRTHKKQNFLPTAYQSENSEFFNLIHVIPSSVSNVVLPGNL